MHAIILAGGFGKRLQARCSTVPKPLAPIAEKPFLTYLLSYLAGQGITSATLSVHYLADIMVKYLQEQPQAMRLDLCYEQKPLGTGGAVRNALLHYKEQEPVWVLNGDSFMQLDFSRMYAAHNSCGTKLTMALRPMADCSRYGKVQVIENHVVGFEEKGEGGSGLINAGVYLLEPDIFQSMELPEVFSLETDFLQPMANMIKPRAFISEGYFIDIGIPADYDRAQHELPHYFQMN